MRRVGRATVVNWPAINKKIDKTADEPLLKSLNELEKLRLFCCVVTADGQKRLSIYLKETKLNDLRINIKDSDLSHLPLAEGISRQPTSILHFVEMQNPKWLKVVSSEESQMRLKQFSQVCTLPQDLHTTITVPADHLLHICKFKKHSWI